MNQGITLMTDLPVLLLVTFDKRFQGSRQTKRLPGSRNKMPKSVDADALSFVPAIHVNHKLAASSARGSCPPRRPRTSRFTPVGRLEARSDKLFPEPIVGARRIVRLR